MEDNSTIIEIIEIERDRKNFFNNNPQFSLSKDGTSKGNFEKILAECTNCKVNAARLRIDRLKLLTEVGYKDDPARWYDHADELTPDELVERVIQIEECRDNIKDSLRCGLIIGYTMDFQVHVRKHPSLETMLIDAFQVLQQKKYKHSHFYYSAANPPRYLTSLFKPSHS